jgi:uncharacterized membrane protein
VTELVKSFLAFASVITGVLLIVFMFKGEFYYVDNWICGILGVALLAGGVTYFWTRSKFYKK